MAPAIEPTRAAARPTWATATTRSAAGPSGAGAPAGRRELPHLTQEVLTGHGGRRLVAHREPRPRPAAAVRRRAATRRPVAAPAWGGRRSCSSTTRAYIAEPSARSVKTCARSVASSRSAAVATTRAGPTNGTGTRCRASCSAIRQPSSTVPPEPPSSSDTRIPDHPEFGQLRPHGPGVERLPGGDLPQATRPELRCGPSAGGDRQCLVLLGEDANLIEDLTSPTDSPTALRHGRPKTCST